MDIENMELEQLKEQENYLRKELSTISAKIENYNYHELEKTYGGMFNCRNCRYDIGLDFSGDGWHNLCGNTNADTCTCCGGPCTKFKPDTQYTKWLKLNSDHSISPEFQRAILLCFKVNIYADEIPADKWEAIEHMFKLTNRLRKDKSSS